MVTIQKLIQRQEIDLAGFQQSIASLSGKPGTRQLIGDLERRSAMAKRAIAMLRAAKRTAHA